MIDATGNYICDRPNKSACLPLQTDSSGKLQVYHEGPFQDYSNYNFSQVIDKNSPLHQSLVLDYPYQGKCKGEIKRVKTPDDYLKELRGQYQRSDNVNKLLKEQREREKKTLN